MVYLSYSHNDLQRLQMIMTLMQNYAHVNWLQMIVNDSMIMISDCMGFIYAGHHDERI
jgi:hypothetical protein